MRRAPDKAGSYLSLACELAGNRRDTEQERCNRHVFQRLG